MINIFFLLIEDNINEEQKKLILKTVYNLKISKNFGLNVIKSYIAEEVCYILNKIMRNII
jgi:hypothetical protein